MGRARVSSAQKGEEDRPGLPEDRSAALRMMSIHREIARGARPSVKKLAEEHEVSARTIQRDMEGLRDRLGAPIEYDSARRGYFYSEKYRLPLLTLTEGEVIALVLGAGMISRYRGTPFHDDVRGALNKIAHLFPEHISADLGTIDRILTFDEEEIRGQGTSLEEHLVLVERAIRDREVLEGLYYSPGRNEHTVRQVAVHHIHIMGGAVYIVAYCYLRKDMRTFALDRFEHLVPTGRHFRRQQDFSIEDYLGAAWGIERGEKTKITVRFAPLTARFIRERRWHPSQVLEEQPDGSLLAQFEVAGMGELARWIRQYGSQAEVIRPEWLREEMRKEAFRMTDVYSRKHE